MILGLSFIFPLILWIWDFYHFLALKGGEEWSYVRCPWHLLLPIKCLAYFWPQITTQKTLVTKIILSCAWKSENLSFFIMHLIKTLLNISSYMQEEIESRQGSLV